MVATPVAEGFTQDVISLVTIAGSEGTRMMRDAVQKIQNREDQIDFLRDGLVQVLHPSMHAAPLFVRVIVARAIMEYVDWDAVIDRLLIVPENN